MKKQLSVFLTTILFCLAFLQTGYSQVIGESSNSVAGESQQKLDIVLVLDNSGSMKINDPEFLTQNVVTDFLIGFSKTSRLGMVIFDQDARLVEPLNELSGQLARVKFLKSLEKIDYTGLYSDTPAAIERAIYELKKNGRTDARKLIILLTDGIVDTGNKQKDIVKEQWLKEALTEESARAEIRIIGIAFTDKADFSLIQTLAIKTNGEYFRAFQAEDIQGIFNKINEMIFAPSRKAETVSTPGVETPDESQATASGVTRETPAKEPGPLDESASPPLETKPPALPSKGSETAERESLFQPMVLAGIFLLLGIIVLILVFNRKSRAFLHPGASGASISPEKGLPMPKAELVDVKNITTKKTFQLNERITKIGRDPNNYVAIPQDTVSGLHAVIEYRDGFFYLEDHRSKNKTRLNGKEISPFTPVKLKNGDEVSINIYKFIFILPDMIPAGETVLDFREGSDTMMSDDILPGEPKTLREDIAGMPQAILIDAENITGKKTFALSKRKIKIGRGVYNEVSIDQSSISGSHAVIEYKEGSFYLEDQKSMNKTRINGEEIVPYSSKKLKSGDEIMFDIYKFIFLLERQLPSGDTGRRWPEE